MTNFNNKVSLIWNIAELLRGSWKRHEYQDVVLPLVVLKRLDDALSDNKYQILDQYNQYHGKVKNLELVLKETSGTNFFNVSDYTFEKLLDEPKHIAKNFRSYLNGFSEDVKDVIDKFDFEKQIERLEGGNLLYMVMKEINKVDLNPDQVDNHEMGYIFEELLRKFSELSNETAGEHYTPREVIEMMVQVLFAPDEDRINRKHAVKTIYDPACGTGGMLSVAKDYITNQLQSKTDTYVFGQELNSVTYAISKADMLIKGEDPDRIKGGDKDHSKASTLSNDQFFSEKFDYELCNPPFGVDWKKDKNAVDDEAERGFAGRFGAGLPRISDGQFLFLQHMISKMRNPVDGGSRIAIVFNGSPLFTGDAGSGESEIRRWILEHDWLEAIIAMPDQLFYNTGISTYVWVLSNRKEKKREEKVQLIDARHLFKKMRKSLGNKRHEISDENRAEILKLYNQFKVDKYSKIFKTTDFAFRQITIERPLRLNFQASKERIECLKENKTFAGLMPSKKKGEKGDKENEEWQKLREQILKALDSFGDKIYKNRKKFIEAFNSALDKNGATLSAALTKIILQELSERDETADVCVDKNNKPEPDSELRDTENVPWGTDARKYFEKEVVPYVSDAWIDESKVDEKDGKLGRVGYEIPFTRHFYTYEPPRDVEEIEKDIKEVEDSLLGMMEKL